MSATLKGAPSDAMVPDRSGCGGVNHWRDRFGEGREAHGERALLSGEQQAAVFHLCDAQIHRRCSLFRVPGHCDV